MNVKNKSKGELEALVRQGIAARQELEAREKGEPKTVVGSIEDITASDTAKVTIAANKSESTAADIGDFVRGSVAFPGDFVALTANVLFQVSADGANFTNLQAAPPVGPVGDHTVPYPAVAAPVGSLIPPEAFAFSHLRFITRNAANAAHNQDAEKTVSLFLKKR
jgi:hypothetical protein